MTTITSIAIGIAVGIAWIFIAALFDLLRNRTTSRTSKVRGHQAR